MFDSKGKIIFTISLITLTLLFVGLFKVIVIIAGSFLITTIVTGRYKHVVSDIKSIKDYIIFKMIEKEINK